MHFKVIAALVFQFIMLGIPSIGLFYVDGIAWKITFWIIWLAWMTWIAAAEKLTKNCIAIMYIQIPFMILFSLKLWTGIWPWVWTLWSGSCLSYAYSRSVNVLRIMTRLEETQSPQDSASQP